MKRELTLLVNDVEYVVTVSRQGDTLVVEHDGERYNVAVREDRTPVTGAVATESGPDLSVQSASSSRTAPVKASPGSGPTTPAATTKNAPTAPGALDGAVPAPMVGVVREIHVSIGADVNEGETLITMEAMKMEISVTAPCAGRVSALHCAVGDTTADGTLLAEIAPAGTDAP